MLLIFHTPLLSSPDDWQFLYETDDIRVYHSIDKVNDLIMYRAEGVLELNIFELMAVLTDIPRRIEWMDGLAEIQLLEGDSTVRGTVFSVFDLPWPIADRESIVLATGIVDYHDLSVVIAYETVPWDAMPVGRGRVRVPFASGRNSLQFVDPDRTRVTIEMQMNPGGHLPVWIANLFIKSAPVKTLKALRIQVLQTRGQYEDFIRKHAALASESRGSATSDLLPPKLPD